MKSHQSYRNFLIDLYQTGVERVRAETCLPAHLPPPPKNGRLIILGAGKAAADMARIAEAHYRGLMGNRFEALCTGLVVTRYGHRAALTHIEVIEAGHPNPDQAGLDAARRILALASSATANDLVLVLLSGGGSALLSLPRPGISLNDKRGIIKNLMQKGAAIGELNTVRKSLSAIKGGQLAQAAAPASIITLAISDVPGDDPAIIASGPTVIEPSPRRRAVKILEHFKILMPSVLKTPDAAAPAPEALLASEYHLIATPADALEAARGKAVKQGYQVQMLGDALEGEARALARQQAELALHCQATGRGLLILSGGEVTVSFDQETVGQGGPNQEFALALAMALNGNRSIYALSCDTDGNDGGRGHADDPAGAVIDPETLNRARSAGIDVQQALNDHDSGHLFSITGDLIQTGPTLTNVNDFRAILCLDAS